MRHDVGSRVAAEGLGDHGPAVGDGPVDRATEQVRRRQVADDDERPGDGFEARDRSRGRPRARRRDRSWSAASRGRRRDAPPGTRASRPSSVGTSGSRNGTLRWTGPQSPEAPRAAATARDTTARHWACWPARRSGVPSSCDHRTAAPNMPGWTVVWLAPVPRSSGGRSALSTMRGTMPWWASSTAGCRLATAVPEVVTTTAGTRVSLAEAEGEEARGPLVHPHVQGQPAGAVSLLQGIGQRRRARARTEHRVADPLADQLVDQHGGERGGRVHGS